ncbi:LuxR C-terminal-related transcriptional regulator [Nocardia sp. NPDC052112]|uniref:LuxR C-terminal-related transcriptional regulator n=1 Tax=Nocardia sp. NPDC052112 TaxID=3155646 RepID=UPI0034431C26
MPGAWSETTCSGQRRGVHRRLDTDRRSIVELGCGCGAGCSRGSVTPDLRCSARHLAGIGGEAVSDANRIENGSRGYKPKIPPVQRLLPIDLPTLLHPGRFRSVRRSSLRRQLRGADTPALATNTSEWITKTERQVAELIAEGLSSRVIADRLVISPRASPATSEPVIARPGAASGRADFGEAAGSPGPIRSRSGRGARVSVIGRGGSKAPFCEVSVGCSWSANEIAASKPRWRPFRWAVVNARSPNVRPIVCSHGPRAGNRGGRDSRSSPWASEQDHHVLGDLDLGAGDVHGSWTAPAAHGSLHPCPDDGLRCQPVSVLECRVAQPRLPCQQYRWVRSNRELTISSPRTAATGDCGTASKDVPAEPAHFSCTTADFVTCCQ